MEAIVKLDRNNLEEEHICCAISDKKCRPGYDGKKEWIRNQLSEGFVFKKLDVRGKVFIEYIPAEKAWNPIIAPDYMMINCFWVSGQYKGQGNGKRLLDECIKDSEGKNGIVAITSSKKQAFLSDKKFFLKQGFELCDTAEPYFELMFKRFKKDAPVPSFKEIAKKGMCDNMDGLTVYYTRACPFNEYYVAQLSDLAKKKGFEIKTVRIDSMEQAQNHFVPYTNYGVFKDGKFVTQHIINEKYFDKFLL